MDFHRCCALRCAVTTKDAWNGVALKVIAFAMALVVMECGIELHWISLPMLFAPLFAAPCGATVFCF